MRTTYWKRQYEEEEEEEGEEEWDETPSDASSTFRKGCKFIKETQCFYLHHQLRINTNNIVIIVFWVAEVEPLLGLLSLTRAYRLENVATAEQASSDPPPPKQDCLTVSGKSSTHDL